MSERPLQEILLIDDDVELCAMLSSYLAKHGFRVTVVHEGRGGLEMARARPEAIVLLDVMLPDMDGLEIVRQLRSSPSVRVLLLSARGDDVDRILGLEIGADDYLTKPFNPRELVARIRVAMRRGTTAGEGDTFEKVLTVAGMELDTTSRVVSAGATRVELTSVEFMLLELLMRSSGEVLGREYLTEKVLGRRFYQFDRGLDMHISRLRRKLDRLRVPGEPHTLLGEQVKTIRGLGYQLAAAGRKAQEG